jgi:hypothetical protein
MALLVSFHGTNELSSRIFNGRVFVFSSPSFLFFRDLDARPEALLAVWIMHAASLGYYVL